VIIAWPGFVGKVVKWGFNRMLEYHQSSVVVSVLAF